MRFLTAATTMSLLFLGALPEANAKKAPSVACNIAGYSIDKDPNGLNVRSGPGTRHSILARLKRFTASGMEVYPEMDIRESRGSWLRITRATEGMDGTDLFMGNGWVHASLMATSTSGYDKGHAVLRHGPSPSSRIIGKVPSETEVGLRGCNGKWALVEHQGKRGWLAPGDQCGTAATNCN